MLVHVFKHHPLPHSLVLVSLGDTDDQVVLLPVSPAIPPVRSPATPTGATYDQGADSAESSDALTRTVVELDLDDILRGLFHVSVCLPWPMSNSNVRV
jgi:hypothetical protein